MARGAEPTASPFIFLRDQVARYARNDEDGQKVAICGNCSLFFFCGAYFDRVPILVGIPCYNWIRTLVLCMDVLESGHKGTNIYGLECRKNSSERTSKKKKGK